MKGLIIFIRKEKLDAVKAVLQTRNASGMTVSKATGCGRRKRAAETDIHLMSGMEMQQNLLAKFRIE